MIRPLALVAALLLTGCVTPIVSYDKMDEKQIAALVKDKTAAANCVVLNTPYGRGVSTYMALDKSVLEKGALLTIDEQCKMSLTQGSLEQRQAAPTIHIVPVPTPAPAPQPAPPAVAPPAQVLPPDHPSLRPRPQSVPPSPRILDLLRTSAEMHR